MDGDSPGFRPPTHLDDSFGHFPKKSTPHVETRYLSLGSRNTDIEMQDARCNTYMNKTQTTRVKWGGGGGNGEVVHGIIPGCSVLGVTSGPKRDRHGVAIK
jgi:hypothetical protein